MLEPGERHGLAGTAVAGDVANRLAVVQILRQDPTGTACIAALRRALELGGPFPARPS